MAISEQDLLKRDVLKSHIDSVNQRKLDMGPPSPRGNDYTRPVDEHVARGYFDETNQITPLGEEFLTLHDNGLVDNFGMATELGQSYLMSNREAQDAPVSVYRFREESGLAEAERFAALQDGEQRGFSDMIYDFATKSIPSAVETGYNIAIAPVAETALSVPRKIVELATGVDYKLPRTMSPNDITNAVAENMTGSILASEDIAAGAIYAGTMAMDDPATFGANILDKLPYGLIVRKVAGDPVMDEMVRRKTDESFAAKQAFERSRSEIAELTGAQMMETVAPIFQWAKAREQLVAENGEEAVKSKEENDRLLGSIALDPENVLSLGAGIAIKGATTAVAKTNLWAASTSLKNAALQAERAAVQSEMSAIQAGLTRPSRWIIDAELKSKALVDVGDFQGATRYDEFIKRVNLKSEVPLQRISELSATEAKLGDEITQLGSSPDIANAILASKEKAASFRNLTAGGFGLTGVVGDKIGSAMIKADDFLDAASKNMGIDSAVSALKSLPAAIGGYVMGGVPAGVTAALNVLARGKVVQSMGNFSKVLGYELMQERGSIGYWGRVAQNSTLTKAQRFLAHRADELTLGGSLMDVARPVVAGTVAAYPMNLAFEAVSNPDASGQEILTNAMGPALVFGGGSAGAGAVLQGRQAHLAQIRMADEYNFTRRMAEQSTEGSQAFSSLVPSAKRVVSTLAATYPNLNWDFSNKTESYYDPVSNTINVNPESDNPLRPLISHEVLHYVTIRNQMEPVVHSALLGDSETPGLIRNTDGTLDPEFKAFKDVYDARIANANLPPRTIEQVAEEYFNEATVDELLSMVDTGEVSRIAGRTQLGRKVKALIDATIPKITILKDLFNHTGGVRGMDGKPVMGNGLLADGIRDLPEAKAIMRKLIRDSAGQDPTRATSGDRSGTRIEIKRGDSVIDSFHSIFEVDASGNPIRDKNGDPVRLSRATDEARKSAGLIIGEAQRDKVSNGYLPKEGEMKQQANGSWQGRYIDKSLIDVLAGRGILNPKQIAILRNLSTATKGNQGLRFLLTNHPATIRNRKGKLNYATLEATLRESVPVGFSITKDGNILVHNMSVGQLDANITARAGSKRGMDLYSGNTESIKRDVSEMMELHQKNTATDEFYQNKHGSRWKEYQQFINTVFGLMTKEQQSINPMFQSDSISSQKGQVYRTYRLDRISKATRMDGATSMPFHYENIKMNFLPDGFADATKPADTTRYLPENKIEDGFYSQLESVISKKIPTRATPEQIMATIDPTRGSGIKAEEIKWSGIEQALPKLAVDGKVTKEALLKYLADEGNVRFEEVTMGGKNKEARFNELTTMIQEIESSNTRPDNYDSLVREQQQLALDLSPEDSGAKFSQYVLPGGENYREVVLAMPEVSTTQDASSEFKAFMAEMTRKYPNEDGTFPIWSKMTDSEVNRMEVLEGEANAGKFSQTAKKKKEANYTSSHFPDIPNYVAHMRLDERTLGDGTRTLHSAEYQSDRHQEGRKKGYALTPDEKAEIASLEAKAKQNGGIIKLNAEDRARWDELGAKFETPGVADAPFRTTWPLQLFKRQLRDAVEGGFDSVSWDVGETQNDRFDLSKSVDKISVPMVNAESRSVRIDEKGGSSFKMMVRNDGTVEGQMSASQFTGKKLDEVIGKDMADKIMSAKEPVDFEGNDLKVGGSGMRGFYDTMLPKEIGKYVKQWNGKVEKSEIGQSMSKDEIDMYDLEDATPEELAQLKAEGMVKGDAVPIWRVDITPEMRKISETGQTRYLPEGDKKAIDSDVPKKEGGNMRPSTWASLSKVGYSPEASEKTQIATTTPTYESIVKTNAVKGMDVLDFSAGRGIGTRAMKEIGKKVGFSVEGYEPFSNKNTRVIAPEYEGEKSIDRIPDNSKDIIINNAVLNVVPEDTGRKIVNQIYSKLKPGGSAFINVMGWNNIKNRLDNPKTQLVGPREVVTQKGTFQKGYTAQSLRKLIEQELPDASIVRTSHGDIGFKVIKPTTSDIRYLPGGNRLPNGYKSHHDETLLKSAWNGTELDLKRPFKASDSLPSLAMRTKWEEKPLVSKDTFDFTKKARVVFGKNKNGEDVTFKYDPNLLNPPNIVDFAQVYLGEQIQYTIADRMSAVDGDMGGALHLFLKNNDIVIVGPDGKEYVVGWGNNSATVGTKMRKKAKDGAKVLMVYLMGREAHQSNTRTVRLFDTQLENSSMPSHMSNIARAYSYIPIKEMKHASLVKEVFKIDEAIKKAKELNKDSNYINKLEQRKKSASKEADKIKVSAYDYELAGIFRKIKSSQTRLDNGNGKQSIIDANIQELSNFATSAKGKMLIKKTPSKFIYEMTRTFDGRKSAVSQISNLKLDDFNGLALSTATADMTSADKNAIVAGIDLSDNQDFFMLYVGDDPKQISAMTASEKVAATKLKQNSDFVVHEAYDTLILSPRLGRRNLNSRMENALDAVPDSFKAVLDDRPSVKAQVGKKNAKGNLILSEDNLLNTVRDQQTVPLIYNPTK